MDADAKVRSFVNRRDRIEGIRSRSDMLDVVTSYDATQNRIGVVSRFLDRSAEFAPGRKSTDRTHESEVAQLI